MGAKSRDFADEYGDNLQDANMSDEELEALLSGHSPDFEAPARSGSTTLEPGTPVRGTVIDFRSGEILVELDSKTLGVIDEHEFEGDPLPAIGQAIDASVVRHDPERDVVVLGVREARDRIFWEDLQAGTVVEGIVTGTNKGGLTLDIKGNRAFLPVSQIERTRVEDPAAYIGKRLTCEVTSFDRGTHDLVLSRRNVLEREAEKRRGVALARLSEGEVLTGTVTRVVENIGAFIDLGGVEGLLHKAKIHAHARDFGDERTLSAGQRVQVVLSRIDRDRERITLDFHHVASTSRNLEGYDPGDHLTGWVTAIEPDGVRVSVEEGVEGFLPRAAFGSRPSPPGRGSLIRVRVARVDRDRGLLELQLAQESDDRA